MCVGPPQCPYIAPRSDAMSDNESDAVERLFGKLAALSDSSKNSTHMQFSEQWFSELRETMGEAATAIASLREERDRQEQIINIVSDARDMYMRLLSAERERVRVLEGALRGLLNSSDSETPVWTEAHAALNEQVSITK
jgi:hypothetical protein